MLFNGHMIAAGKCSPEQLPIVSVQLNPGKGFAFIECQTPEVCVRERGVKPFLGPTKC